MVSAEKMWIDVAQPRGAPILGGTGRHAGALLPASATCHIDFERTRSKSSTTRCQTKLLSISFTNAAFYAGATGLSTDGVAMDAYIFGGKQLRRCGIMSAR
jgi:hypothetical protein